MFQSVSCVFRVKGATPKVHWYFLGKGEVRAFGLNVDLVYHLIITRHNYDGHGSYGSEFCGLQLILQH
jgi:hypothetical protein